MVKVLEESLGAVRWQTLVALIVAGTVALLTAVPISTAALTRATIRGEGLTDGRHLAVIWLSSGRVRLVRDDEPLDGGYVLGAPEGCPFKGAVGGGELAFDCHQGNGSVPLLYDFSSRRFHEPAGMDQLTPRDGANGETYSTEGVGSQLLRISVVGNHVDGYDLFNWQQGLFVHPTLTATTVLSLNTPDGLKPICAPVRIPKHNVPYEYVGYEHATAVGDYVLRWYRQHLVLQRCGSSRQVTLTTRLHGRPVLTRTYVAWADRRRARIQLLRSGRRFSTALPPPTCCGPPVLRGTEHRLFITDRTAIAVTVPSR